MKCFLRSFKRLLLLSASRLLKGFFQKAQDTGFTTTQTATFSRANKPSAPHSVWTKLCSDFTPYRFKAPLTRKTKTSFCKGQGQTGLQLVLAIAQVTHSALTAQSYGGPHGGSAPRPRRLRALGLPASSVAGARQIWGRGPTGPALPPAARHPPNRKFHLCTRAPATHGP